MSVSSNTIIMASIRAISVYESFVFIFPTLFQKYQGISHTSFLSLQSLQMCLEKISAFESAEQCLAKSGQLIINTIFPHLKEDSQAMLDFLLMMKKMKFSSQVFHKTQRRDLLNKKRYSLSKYNIKIKLIYISFRIHF